MKLSTDTGSLVNHMYSNSIQIIPVVGMGATILHWTDRSAVTIMEVSKSGKEIKVCHDIVTRTDKNGMSECQTYLYETDTIALDDHWLSFTKRRNGTWILKGQTKHPVLLIGKRDHYHDYSF